MNGRALALLLVIVFAASLTAPYLGPAKVARAQQVTYYGPSLQGNYLGELPPSQLVSISVFLPPRNLQELYLVAQEVVNHQVKPLSKQEVLSLFAPSKQDLEAVENYLTSQGFNIVYVSPDRFSVMAEAPASVVEKVFGVKLGLYETPQGTVFYAPEGTPAIPQQLEGTIIMGLTNRTSFMPQYVVAGVIRNHTVIP